MKTEFDIDNIHLIVGKGPSPDEALTDAKSTAVLEAEARKQRVIGLRTLDVRRIDPGTRSPQHPGWDVIIEVVLATPSDPRPNTGISRSFP